MTTRLQYQIDLNIDGSIKNVKDSQQVDSDQCIKLLTRCIKMYEAKQIIMRLLKMSMEKDRLSAKVTQRAFKSEQEA